jgi:hypothetical protein
VRCCMAREILVAFIVVVVGGETVTWDGGDVWGRTDRGGLTLDLWAGRLGFKVGCCRGVGGLVIWRECGS